MLNGAQGIREVRGGKLANYGFHFIHLSYGGARHLVLESLYLVLLEVFPSQDLFPFFQTRFILPVCLFRLGKQEVRDTLRNNDRVTALFPFYFLNVDEGNFVILLLLRNGLHVQLYFLGFLYGVVLL